MNTIIYTTTIENSCLKLATEYFADGDQVVIIPIPVNRLRIYPLSIWQSVQQSLATSSVLIEPSPLPQLLENIEKVAVAKQSIPLDETLLNYINAEGQFWYFERERFIEIRPIKIPTKTTFDENYAQLKLTTQKLVDELKAQRDSMRALQFEALNLKPFDDAVKGAIRRITLGACKDFKIPELAHDLMVNMVIAKVKQQRHNAPKHTKLSLWVYAIARQVCLGFAK
jgi:hypothetical protein